jgi:hypothetical protein
MNSEWTSILEDVAYFTVDHYKGIRPEKFRSELPVTRPKLQVYVSSTILRQLRATDLA